MAGSIDPGLLRRTAHSPSYFALARAGGGRHDELIDFCIPCNPYFPTPEMFGRLGGMLETVLKYYPSDADTITAELCGTLGLNPQTVAMGNGSTELITWIDHLLVRESLATPIPTFGRWTDQPLETGKRVDMFRLPEAHDFAFDVDAFTGFVRERGSRVAVVCNPNNPDGGYVARREVLRLLDLLVDLDLVVVDESFIDFVDAEPLTSVADEAAIRPNVIVLKSLGKNFGLHGIRFGYLVANPALAGRVRRALPKWNLNSFAEVVVFLLKEHREEYLQSLARLAADRRAMAGQLESLPGLKVFPSQGNFIMIRLPDGRDGVGLRDYLLNEHGVFVRECGNKLGGGSQFLRLVVRPQPDVHRLVTGLAAYLYGTDKARPISHLQLYEPSGHAQPAEQTASADRIPFTNQAPPTQPVRLPPPDQDPRTVCACGCGDPLSHSSATTNALLEAIYSSRTS
ncbi:Histidinol-phosphate/aromatic aminotransferase or cobyric acid decarboxylase [Thermomonospora echinospora]|uniref:Histidinol-phosphate/aromatic aminotransferase or cobyric acid decarboxylase n=1 Tax=Thermomonospora echinospora TaxID=1992 RepID=A0A1H6CJB5_9ACTN|nr:histidinol-phosphate transaminase [Thermomonospora echinospora]SEG73074.1 Histidinol-phosphate/aromatic aminotransferase or cobyric acid decarboxylase [Thermomonospora echinospora]